MTETHEQITNKDTSKHLAELIKVSSETAFHNYAGPSKTGTAFQPTLMENTVYFLSNGSIHHPIEAVREAVNSVVQTEGSNTQGKEELYLIPIKKDQTLDIYIIDRQQMNGLRQILSPKE